jgi:hypothetical protein
MFAYSRLEPDNLAQCPQPSRYLWAKFACPLCETLGSNRQILSQYNDDIPFPDLAINNLCLKVEIVNMYNNILCK